MPLPLGTGNKTERLLGYFTWHADDSPPVNPIGDLFKTQVWALARHLGVPQAIIEKPASADLIEGQTDEGDFGVSYGVADEILNWVLHGWSAAELVARGVDAEAIRLVTRRLDSTHWKRRLPTVAMVSGPRSARAISARSITDAAHARGESSAPVIRYGVHPTPYGEGLIATTGHGSVGSPSSRGGGARPWRVSRRSSPRRPSSRIRARTTALMKQAFDHRRSGALALDLKGTAFQRRVWSELLQIPRGATTTYGGLAARIGAPSASRAVGSAVGANPVCFVVALSPRGARRRDPRGYAWGPGEEGRDAR